MEYQSNSHRSKETANESIPEKKVGPVISGTAMAQKQTGFGKFAKSIIAEDINSVGNYLLTDVLIPSFKKALADIVTNGIDMLLYGKSGVSNSSRVTASKVSYSNYYMKPAEPSRQVPSGSVLDYDNIIFSSRGDAEAVLTSMDEMVDRYGVVSVGDLYDMADVSTSNYTVHKYGWTNIRSAQVVRVRDGYMIKLPKATPIN